METVNENRGIYGFRTGVDVLTIGIQNINWENMAFDWDDGKNNWLRGNRMISFQEIVIRIREGFVIQVGIHPNPKRYPKQHVIYVWIRDYVWVVPVVFSKNGVEVFLKTAYPSRRYTEELGRITW